jgi:hypothetical protein
LGGDESAVAQHGEGSTRLWETQPEQMTAALALLNQTVNEAMAAHDGVRPLEQQTHLTHV